MMTKAEGTKAQRGGWKMRFDLRHSAFVILCALTTANAQSCGGYVIKKSTIDSGGGTVAGGGYRLSGTAGQHDAGRVSGGGYELTGGFWSPAANPPDPMMPDPSG